MQHEVNSTFIYIIIHSFSENVFLKQRNLGPGRYNLPREIQTKGTSESIGPINTTADRFSELRGVKIKPFKITFMNSLLRMILQEWVLME